MDNSTRFINALKNNDRSTLKQIAKADLHNHAVFSCDKTYLLENGYIIPKSKSVKDISSLISFARQYIKPIQNNKGGLECLLKGTINKCIDSGVSIVDTNIDYKVCMEIFDSNVEKFIDFLKKIKNKNLETRWIIDISRDSYVQEKHEKLILEMLESNFFSGVDLTATENCVSNEKFKEIYKVANKLNLITKVHAGEQLGADYIKECILDFNPKQIQHGIKIIESEEVMQLAKENNIVFNICPTSNVVLGYAKSIKNHPAKQMVDFGLKVTIATDDVLFFESDINDEYLKLYNNKVLTAEQLDKIRIIGLGL